MKVISLKHGSALAHFVLNSQGFIELIGHQYNPEFCIIDDVWRRRDLYKYRTPDFTINSYLNNGWTILEGRAEDEQGSSYQVPTYKDQTEEEYWAWYAEQERTAWF